MGAAAVSKLPILGNFEVHVALGTQKPPCWHTAAAALSQPQVLSHLRLRSCFHMAKLADKQQSHHVLGRFFSIQPLSF